MGMGYKGNTGHQHSLEENLPGVTPTYPQNGNHFGKSHEGSTKRYDIETDDPYATAKDFYDKIGLGGIYQYYNQNDGMEMVRLRDGTIITYRQYTSSKGSPAVDINVKYTEANGGLKSHRIHFSKPKEK